MAPSLHGTFLPWQVSVDEKRFVMELRDQAAEATDLTPKGLYVHWCSNPRPQHQLAREMRAA